MRDRPPCPRCSAPYEPSAAERYWEARWRDEKAENDRLRNGLKAIVNLKNPMPRAAVREACAELLNQTLSNGERK
jgi:uncharacterized protein (DUF2236 family)